MVALPSPKASPKPYRKISLPFSVMAQKELNNYKRGKDQLASAIRNDTILRQGSIAFGIAQWIRELEKASRLETERNSGEVIYEIIRLANEISDFSAFKIIKNVRKRELKESDLPECAFKPADPKRPEVASINKLLRVLSYYGILHDDPRLGATVDRQQEIEEELENDEMPTNPFTKDQFIQCVYPAIELIARAFRNELEIPQWRDFITKVKEIFEEARKDTDGKIATYIPQLARQNPDLYGLAMCTIDGARLHLGDSKVPFCLQSVSKAFNYATVSSELGNEAIHKYVGHEPSGRNFNEICLNSEMKPHNPMINAGAIIVTSLIKTNWPMAERFDCIIEKYRQFAGTYPVEFNNAVFLSERDTADRNYALAYYMKENDCFPPTDEIMNLREELELYFQLCSLECNCETLSVMAATLANGGINPLTYEICMTTESCRDTLSLMFSCGMYDLSGKFAFQVGLPAKSGVSGVIMVVIPSVLGFAIFSPRLDDTGNSSRGVEFCRKFIGHYSFHNYDHLNNPDKKKINPRREKKLTDRDIIVSLLFAVKKNNMDLLHRYFMKGFDLQMADYDGRTALHIASAEGHYDMVKFLLRTCGVQHDPKDRWERTPLEEAIKFKHSRIEQLLIKYHRKELIHLGVVESSDQIDTSDFSDEEEITPLQRTRRPTVIERIIHRPLPGCESPEGSITPLARSPESVKSTASTASTIKISSTPNSPKKEKEPIVSHNSEAVLLRSRPIDLPPIIRRPSTHGFKR